MKIINSEIKDLSKSQIQENCSKAYIMKLLKICDKDTILIIAKEIRRVNYRRTKGKDVSRFFTRKKMQIIRQLSNIFIQYLQKKNTVNVQFYT